MIKSIYPLLLTVVLLINKTASAQVNSSDVKHVKVYYEPGRYGGWPANNGIWIWGNEILVGFSKGYYKDLGIKHNLDREKEVIQVLARSKDGGETWAIEDPAKNGLLPVTEFGVQRKDIQLTPVQKLDHPMNLSHPDFAFTARMAKNNESSFWYSTDRGHQWSGPFELPDFDGRGTLARTDYLVDSKTEAILFLTLPKKDGNEGQIACVKTSNGGKTWKIASWVGNEPTGYSIMPASVRLSKNEILVTTRDREGDESFISTYYSKDNGNSWTSQGKAVDDTGIGNPPAMVKLKDGRVCLIYGYRSDPDGTKTSDIRARLSSDKGKTWSKDYVLRNDGSGRDIGYPRVVQRPDGKVVAVYYFMDKATGPERYIGASIWTPPVK